MHWPTRLCAPDVAKLAVVSILSALLCGCLNSSTVILVRQDGSGTVTEKVLVTMLANGLAGINLQTTNAQPMKAICLNRALAMGRGVRLDSFKDISENEMTGYVASYVFDDVSNLIINQQPDLLLLGRLAPQQPARCEPLTFSFARSKPATLTINIPKPAARPKELAPPYAPMKRLSQEEKAVVRKMFDKFRVTIRVQVEGSIQRTNASGYEPSDKSGLTLLDLNISKLISNDQQLEKLLAIGRIDNIDDARIKLADMSSLQIETVRRVEVEFK